MASVVARPVAIAANQDSMLDMSDVEPDVLPGDGTVYNHGDVSISGSVGSNQQTAEAVVESHHLASNMVAAILARVQTRVAEISMAANSGHTVSSAGRDIEYLQMQETIDALKGQLVYERAQRQSLQSWTVAASYQSSESPKTVSDSASASERVENDGDNKAEQATAGLEKRQSQEAQQTVKKKVVLEKAPPETTDGELALQLAHAQKMRLAEMVVSLQEKNETAVSGSHPSGSPPRRLTSISSTSSSSSSSGGANAKAMQSKYSALPGIGEGADFAMMSSQHRDKITKINTSPEVISTPRRYSDSLKSPAAQMHSPALSLRSPVDSNPKGSRKGGESFPLGRERHERLAARANK